MKAFLALLLVGVAVAVTFPSTQQCTTLCDMYQMGTGSTGDVNCSSTYNIYTDSDACMLECSKFPITSTCNGDSEGDGCTEAAGENSYSCRLYHLQVATDGTAGNQDLHCQHSTPLSIMAESGTPNAGPCLDTPGADDQPKTGLIQDLCNNLVATCGDLFGTSSLTMQYCYNAMYHIPGIATLTGYPTEAAPFPITAQTGADNLMCRRYHVWAAAALDQPEVHCSHAITGNGQCGENCDFYCDTIMGACVQNNTQYTDMNDCMTACQSMDEDDFNMPLPTGGADAMYNTLNCRIYHATVAAQSPDLADVHCDHAGEMSTPETCGYSSAAGLSASLFLVALLAFFSLN